MAKRTFYIYNATTDNFERYFPSFKRRIASLLKILLCSFLLSAILIWILYIIFGFNNYSFIKKENQKLKEEVKTLNQQVTQSLSILEEIKNRDDNFYRVLLQLEPMNSNIRYAGLANKDINPEYQGLSNADMLNLLARNVDLLNRQLYAQSLSFDQIRNEAFNQRNKINHVPGILPLKSGNFSLSSGYGYRVDPWQGGTKFHNGLDFMAPVGTPVYATADGVVTKATLDGVYGNNVEIEHGFNYKTVYAHLSEIKVKEGDKIKRGELLGKTGNSGKSSGPHLHYEVRFKDKPENPVNYYFLDITPEQYRQFIDMAAEAGNLMD